MLQTLAIAHYRSLHGLVLPLQRLNVVTGDNGTMIHDSVGPG